MQRRAVAIYFAFFVVLGAGAYGLIQTTQAPTVSMDGPTYEEGDAVELGDRTYTVSSVSGDGEDATGELTWVNESGEISTSLDNGSEIPVTDVVWEDQAARMSETFGDGDTVAYNDSEYEVGVNASAGTLTLTNPENEADNTTLEVGDTVEYQGFEATVTGVSDGEATVVWGSDYLLLTETENVTDPTEATFHEQRNLTQLATADPALYDQVSTINGTQMVTFRENDSNVPVDEYFRDAETHTVSEGDTLQYQGNETTVDAVENESVVLTRSGETTTTLELAEGENVTVGDEQYFAHFPSNGSVQLHAASDSYGEYVSQNDRIEDYNETIVGLWGIVVLTVAALIVLLGTAFLPVKG